MRKLIALALMFTLSAQAVAPVTDGTITLTKDNHVTLRGDIEDKLIDDTILEIERSKQKNLYLFIESNGGSVFAGIKLLEYLDHTDKKITCIANTAISMAHQIMQHCQIRAGTPTNIMMQHRMSSAAKGSINVMEGLLNVFTKLEAHLNETSAARIGVTLEYFVQKTTAEWWTFGKESRELNMVDKILAVKCSADLYSTTYKRRVAQDGVYFSVLVNGCPLVSMIEDPTPLP